MATLSLPRLLRPTPPRPGVLYPHAQWYFFAAMVLTWVGFSQTYFATLPRHPLLHHIHGALMGGWIALLILQPLLYQRGFMRLHRTLGRWGTYLIVPGIIVCGILMVRSMVRSSRLSPSVTHELAFLDLSSLLLFGLCIALGILQARNLQLHARWIACTVLLLMPPAVGRGLFYLPQLHSLRQNARIAVGLVVLFTLVLILDDLRRGRVRAPYPILFLLLTVIGFAAAGAAHWAWWSAVLAHLFA